MFKDLRDALRKIEELEKENAELKSEIEEYQAKKYGGRKKHDELWMNSYHDFEAKYEAGMTIMEIVNTGDISRRTAYRYKAYYEEIRKIGERKGTDGQHTEEKHTDNA